MSNSAGEPSLPLRGIKVVDFTHVLAGPFCTQLMADAGADVIKIETAPGEMARFLPPLRKMESGVTVSTYETGVNRGKRSVAVDLKSEEGRKFVLDMIDTADIAIESFAPGVLARLGIDFTAARQRRPSLITASISLYGSHDAAGDLANRKGLAIIAEAESGVTWVNRDEHDVPHAFMTPFADLSTGLCTYAAIMTALYARKQTDVGQHISMSMVKTMLSMNTVGLMNAQLADPTLPMPTPAGYAMFKTKDSYVAMAAVQNAHFDALAKAMGRTDLLGHPDYETIDMRAKQGTAINKLITAWTVTKTSDELVEELGAAGVPIGYVRDPLEIAENPELMPDGFLDMIEEDVGEPVRVPANPMGYQTSNRFPRFDADGDAIRTLAADGASVWKTA